MKADIKIDATKVRLELDQLARGAIPQAVSRALNRAATSARAEAVRAIRVDLPLPAKSLRGRLRLFPASRARLSAAIIARRDYDPPLGLFAPQWRQRQPVGASIKMPGKARQSVPGAFTAQTRYKRLAVFRRVGRQRRPLQFLRASDVGLPTLSRLFLQAAADSRVLARARERFRIELDREMRFRRR